MTGEWPKYDVDHRDTDPSNNRWLNLRDIPHAHNLQNQRRAQPHNRSGVYGAHLSNGRFESRVWVGGKSVYVGSFDTAQEAHEAFVDAKRRLHPGCTI